MRVVQLFLACLGRILISLIFILAAIGHMMDWQGSVQLLTQGLHAWTGYAASMPQIIPIIDQLLGHVPLLMGIAVVFMFLGGLFVFFGVKTRFGAFLLLLFLVATSLIMHPFWYLHAPDRELQMIMFMKNLSIMGAMLYLLAFGNGGSKVAKKSKSGVAEEK